MPSETRKFRFLPPLAPLAFVGGLLLIGLSLLALGFTATAPGYGPVTHYETYVIEDHGVMVFAVPLSPTVPSQIQVEFRFPVHAGSGMAVDCRDMARILDGREPLSPEVSSGGGRGAFSTTGFSGSSANCPFAYVVMRWALSGEPVETNRPEVDVTTLPIVMPAIVGAVLVGTLIIGATASTLGGIAWGRRLNRERIAAPAGTTESTTETLLIVLHRTGEWLQRTRRYLIVAGALGIFLWYPVVLPWAWTMALQGSPARLYPWIIAAAAVFVLFALSAVWTREFLRLDRELLVWRDRVHRLREREAAMLAELGSSG